MFPHSDCVVTRNSTPSAGPTRNGQVFFKRKRMASMEAATTTEDAPASKPKGCRCKRAIITYARRVSKAYRPVTFAVVKAIRGRGADASVTDLARALRLEPIVQ